jgi:hypothetical protein
MNMSSMEKRTLISGFIGAVTLTLVHQSFKLFYKDSPKVDLLGVRIIKDAFKKTGFKAPKSNTLYNLSLAGDILFNSLYYSFTAGKNSLAKGISLGSAAGLGVISIPQLFNYGKDLNAKNFKQKALALVVYLSGGLASSLSYKLLSK